MPLPKRPDAARRVAIVGGGFSGLMTAIHLARAGHRAILIEQRAQLGQGVAYGTRDPAHLLNVPAAKMSAFPDRPDDFAAYAAAAIGAAPGDFVPRQLYGDYLAALAAEGGFERVTGAATAARRTGEGWTIELADGARVAADALVLAMGNGRPAPFAVPGLPEALMVQDPWSAEAQAVFEAAAGDDRPLLLVGTGLTMVDMVLGLDRMGHRGPVTAVSRRGLVPRAHAPGVVPMEAPTAGEVPAGLSRALRWIRARAAAGGWRAAVDSVRPVTQDLWAGWPDAVKARFLRHARPWWDVHRHRIAPEAARLVQQEIAEGRLRILAGRVRGFADGMVTVDRRGGGESRVAAALVVNCTGPVEGLASSRNALVRQMLADGLIAPGPLGLGVAADRDGRIADDLWAVGPMLKGEAWEITAVPDIRVQANELKETISVKTA